MFQSLSVGPTAKKMRVPRRVLDGVSIKNDPMKSKVHMTTKTRTCINCIPFLPHLHARMRRHSVYSCTLPHMRTPKTTRVYSFEWETQRHPQRLSLYIK